MPFKAPMSVFLAFALVVSCYPFSVAYADDEGSSDGRSYYSPVSDSGAGGNPGADGQAVEAEAEEAYSLDSPLPSSGSGLAFSGDILPATGDDHSGAIQVDGMADVDGRTGKAANADAQEQHEADSDGREAVAQDAGAAEAQEVYSSPLLEEVGGIDDGIESGNSIGLDGIESGQLALSSGTGTAYLSGSLSGDGGDLSNSSGIGGKESNYEGQSNFQLDNGGPSSLSGDSYDAGSLDRYKVDGSGSLLLSSSGEVQQVDISNGQSRVAPIAAILPELALYLGVGSSVVGIAAGLTSLFGSSMSKTEGLLAIISNTLLASHEQLRSIETSTSNLDRVFAQVYSSDFSYISDIYSRLYATSASGYDITSWVAGVYNHVIGVENSSKNLSEVFYNSNSVFNTRFARLLGASEGVNSNLSSFVSENAGWYVRQGRILGAIDSFTSENAGWYTRLGRITGAVENLDSSISAFTSENASWYTRFARLLNASEGIYSLLSSYLPKLSAPAVSVSFDDSSILNSLSLILAALSENGAIAVAVDVDTSELSNLRAVELKAIYDAIKEIPGGGGDVLDKVLSGVDAIGSVLGGISGFLNPGEVVDGVTDVLGNIADVPEMAEGFIGDLEFDSIDSLASNVNTVVQRKFPFSIPFVFNGVLLMFQASAAPPVFEFDFWGSPMVLDFSDYEGLAEFTRFFSVFFWLIGLLSVSRRFIFFGGGSGAD